LTELGNRLKEARLAKGLSLDDLQSMTKIQKRYLVGIEEGNYDSMPGNFYVRAFIKQYAEAVQIDPDEIFETYKSEIPVTYNEDLPVQLSRVKTRKAAASRSPVVYDVLPKVLIAVFIIGAAALLYYFLQQHAKNNATDTLNKQNQPVSFVKSKDLEKSNTQSKKTETNTSSSKNNNTNKSGGPAQPAPPKQTITVVKNSGINTTYQVQNANKFVVKLVSRGQTWVNIKNSKGVSLFQGLLKSGGSKTVDLSNDSSAFIVVGRTVDTDIYVNDQKINYTIPPTQVVRQNITIQYVPKNK
jgi:cytoskeletal protein RodZ